MSSYQELKIESCLIDFAIHSADQRQGLHFQLQQTFDLVEPATRPRQLHFWQLSKSKDLLLCLSNATPTQSLRIYQHKGITGFQQIIGDSTLPPARYLQLLQLSGAQQELLALVSEDDGAYLVAAQFMPL